MENDCVFNKNRRYKRKEDEMTKTSRNVSVSRLRLLQDKLVLGTQLTADRWELEVLVGSESPAW